MQARLSHIVEVLDGSWPAWVVRVSIPPAIDKDVNYLFLTDTV